MQHVRGSPASSVTALDVEARLLSANGSCQNASEKWCHMLPFGARQTNLPPWRKASFCASGECVEVAQRNGMIVLRSSNGPRGISAGPRRRVRYTAEEWQAFVLGVKAGEFDNLG